MTTVILLPFTWIAHLGWLFGSMRIRNFSEIQKLIFESDEQTTESPQKNKRMKTRSIRKYTKLAFCMISIPPLTSYQTDPP
jgi:hypothetical protein